MTNSSPCPRFGLNRRQWPTAVTLSIGLILWQYGPIPQPSHYHDFADQLVRWGIPHAFDVISNLGFLLVGVWGLRELGTWRRDAAPWPGWYGFRLFAGGLVLTAFGSAYYHWAPDNLRLVWDRLPIALCCAGLLAAARAESSPGIDERCWINGLAAAAALSVGWWSLSEKLGHGDLRPYLMIQFLPLVLIPLWLAAGRSTQRDRRQYGLAIVLYAAAKAVELGDLPIHHLTGWIGGHTLKHLLAALAAAVLVGHFRGKKSDIGAKPAATRREGKGDAG